MPPERISSTDQPMLRQLFHRAQEQLVAQPALEGVAQQGGVGRHTVAGCMRGGVTVGLQPSAQCGLSPPTSLAWVLVHAHVEERAAQPVDGPRHVKDGAQHDLSIQVLRRWRGVVWKRCLGDAPINRKHPSAPPTSGSISFSVDSTISLPPASCS